MTLRTLGFGAPSPAVQIVLLPPVQGGPEDAIGAGFVAALEARAHSARLMLVDLPLQGPADRERVDAVWQECVLPALHDGRRVWLAGISLGAWLALLASRRHDDARAPRLAGVALLAPWLGTREVHREILAAGGVQAWSAAAGTAERVSDTAPGSLAEERAAWRSVARAEGAGIWLGFGRGDRFAAAQELLAGVLPAERVRRIDGGHDWHSWARIWEHLLEWLMLQ